MTDSNDFKNTQWFKEIDEIYHTFSLIIDERYTPGSKKEIENAKIQIAELKSRNKGNSDFDAEIKHLDNVIIESGKRKFNGSLFTIIGIILGILFMFYMSNRVEMKSGSLLIDKAESIQQDKITKLERKVANTKNEIDYSMTFHQDLKKEIEALEAEEQSNQIVERIGEKKKSLAQQEKDRSDRETTIKESEKEIAFLSSMTAEEYRDYKIKNDQEAASSISGYGWKTILWFLLYLASTFPFVFYLFY